MQIIYAWIKNIVCFLCILNLILQILPGKYRKYVRFFGGILLMVIVLNPVADLVQVSAGFESAWRTESLKGELGDLEMNMKGIEELRSETIGEAYKAEIKRQIEEIAKAYGFTAKETKITFDENEEGVLAVRHINMEVSKSTETNDIAVPKVSDRKVSAEEIENVKKEIQEVYHIQMQNINIIVQE